MANIPSSALSASLDAVQRTTNESIRARQVQALKNIRHNEDVEELDDSAVGSVRDQAQEQFHGQEKDEENGGGEEKVDISSLKDQSPPPRPSPQSESHLDISA